LWLVFWYWQSRSEYSYFRGVRFSNLTLWGSQTPDFLGFENPIMSDLRI
jgi:hypothetical protein